MTRARRPRPWLSQAIAIALACASWPVPGAAEGQVPGRVQDPELPPIPEGVDVQLSEEERRVILSVVGASLPDAIRTVDAMADAMAERDPLWRALVASEWTRLRTRLEKGELPGRVWRPASALGSVGPGSGREAP